MVVQPPVLSPSTISPTPPPVATTLEQSCEWRLWSTCLPLMAETVLAGVEVLGYTIVDKLAPMEIPLLAEHFDEDQPQGDPAALPTISLPSSLLILLC